MSSTETTSSLNDEQIKQLAETEANKFVAMSRVQTVLFMINAKYVNRSKYIKDVRPNYMKEALDHLVTKKLRDLVDKFNTDFGGGIDQFEFDIGTCFTHESVREITELGFANPDVIKELAACSRAIGNYSGELDMQAWYREVTNGNK